MNRMFGSASTAPKQSLAQTVETLEKNVAGLDVKIDAKNNELRELNSKLSNMPESRKRTTKARMRQLILDRKQFEAQRDAAQSQLRNLGHMENMQSTLKNSLVVVDTAKTTNKELKKQFARVNIDEIERMNDELADLMDMHSEIQEAISRGIAPEDVDEDELDAELEELGQEADFDFELERASAAGFLEDEVPDFIDEPVGADKPKVQEVAR